MIVENTVIEERFHIAVKQVINCSITLAVKRWEEEDEQAQDNRTNRKTHPMIGYARKHGFHFLDSLVEIKRDKTTEEA